MPRWGTSNEYPQHMFSWSNKKDISIFGWKKRPICCYAWFILIDVPKNRISIQSEHIHCWSRDVQDDLNRPPSGPLWKYRFSYRFFLLKIQVIYRFFNKKYRLKKVPPNSHKDLKLKKKTFDEFLHHNCYDKTDLNFTKSKRAKRARKKFTISWQFSSLFWD